MISAHPPLEVEGARRVGDALDVSALPSYAFGHRSIMWWGTMGVIAIEGTVFALAVMAYFFLRAQSTDWPMGVPPPDLTWGSVNTLILLASLVPNQWAKSAAQRHDLKGVRVALAIAVGVGIAFITVRFLEFHSLNVRWDTNAYGSIVWTILGLHFVHLVTDFMDTAVLAALMFTGPIEGRRFVDVEENAIYWYFVVGAWIPLYIVVYWAPRLWSV
jgi:cytochrome c oxidase subunit I+III